MGETQLPYVYVYLALAILMEVAATLSLKAANGFTVLIPSLVVVIGYSGSFFCLSMALKAIPVGMAYAIWSGVGIVLTTLFGAVVYKQIPDLPGILGITLIALGVMTLKFFSKTVA